MLKFLTSHKTILPLTCIYNYLLHYSQAFFPSQASRNNKLYSSCPLLHLPFILQSLKYDFRPHYFSELFSPRVPSTHLINQLHIHFNPKYTRLFSVFASVNHGIYLKNRLFSIMQILPDSFPILSMSIPSRIFPLVFPQAPNQTIYFFSLCNFLGQKC